MVVQIRVLHATSITRNHAVYCLLGEKTVRKHLQTKKILQRLLKSMRKPSSRIFFWILDHMFISSQIIC